MGGSAAVGINATFFCSSLSTVYSQRQLESLHQLAVDFVERDGDNIFGKYTCDVFYRNKPPEYFTKCRKKGNKMKVYWKDDNGDPRSPINGRIKGLFFATGVDQDTGRPPGMSPFGSKRVSIPAKTMMTHSNLYFADFYCKKANGPHYVTLVLTKQGSETDGFCEENLKSLVIRNNDFLWRSSTKKVHVTSKVSVEVFYTEDIDLSTLKYPIKSVKVIGRGSSTPGGIEKNSDCPECNLGDESDEETESDEDIDGLAGQFGGNWHQ